MNKGFVILAQNTVDCDYVKCAEVLAASIRKAMPNSNITLVTDNVDHSKYFDYVVALPYGDLEPNSEWKLSNDWQIYEASPYEFTIKLEADMYLPTSVDYWWEVLQNKEIVISETIRDFRGNISNSTFYRNFICNNNLPNVYNALTYFKKGNLAEKFFQTCKTCFEDWNSVTSEFKCNINEPPTTDWVYSIACLLQGVENTTLPNFNAFSMVHMKQYINDLLSEDWTKECVYEISNNGIRVNTYPQLYPFHYHIKNFSDILLDECT
jgi:hypothetical protein